MICKETPEGAGGYYALAAFARQLDSGAEKLGFYDVGDRKSAQRERGEAPNRPFTDTTASYRENSCEESPEVLVRVTDFHDEQVAKITFSSSSQKLFNECFEQVQNITGLELDLVDSMETIQL